MSDLRQSNFGEFRVPGLRNVALTAPYMHAGSLGTLADVAHHYSTLDEERLHAGGERILRRLDLSARERADLVAFLETLTEKEPLHESRERRQRLVPIGSSCRPCSPCMEQGRRAGRAIASIPRERDQSPADERSQPADHREDGVAGQAGARGVPEQEPVGPTQSERGEDADRDEGQLELQESDAGCIPAPGPRTAAAP